MCASRRPNAGGVKTGITDKSEATAFPLQTPCCANVKQMSYPQILLRTTTDTKYGLWIFLGLIQPRSGSLTGVGKTPFEFLASLALQPFFRSLGTVAIVVNRTLVFRKINRVFCLQFRNVHSYV